MSKHWRRRPLRVVPLFWALAALATFLIYQLVVALADAVSLFLEAPRP